ncbi:MAG TPA: hypothetical protein VHM92_06735 [Allosphingosinicella sp.]|nr:hypothetical protein [Allosphingosinicella sp.]
MIKKMLGALAFAVILPAAAHAAEAPAAPAKMHCCCEDKGKKMDCCDEHGRRKGADGQHEGHRGHDMGQKAPKA